MVKYLQMDGVDDYVRAASVTFDAIEIECFIPSIQPNTYHYLINPRDGAPNGQVGNASPNVGAEVAGLYVNDVSVSKSWGSIPKDIITKVKAVYSNSFTDNINFFSDQYGINFFLKGNIYKITCYLSGSVVVMYDMSTGTVQDQSGNGRHATLAGGTWVEDAPTGTDGSITLGLTQQIYSDSSVNLLLTQSIYADISTNLNLIQNIYKDTVAVLDLTQAIYRDSEIGLNLRQEIYAQAESILNLIQEFYEDSQTYITLQLIQQIYKDSSTDLPMTQAIYRDSEINLPLRQELYEEKVNVLSLNQTVYKDDSEPLTLTQIIYKDSFSSLHTVQQVFIEGESILPLLIQIRDDLLSLIGEIRLIGKRVLNVYLQGNRELKVLLKGGIDMTAVNQNFSMIAGDTKSLIATMSEDLTGASVKWIIKKNVNSAENILLKTGTVSGTDITIKLDPVDTVNLVGTYYHECEVTDQLNNVSTIFTGMCLINKSGI
jgi:hypothetical protein